jgi:SAM-dependent methyltransferase
MHFLPDTTVRHLEPELMDDPALDVDSHRLALRGLARINAVSRSAGTLCTALCRYVAAVRNGPVRVLDVACGGGDVTVNVKRLADRGRVIMRIDGCDVSATAVDLATGHANRCSSDARFFQHDALNGPLPGGYDAIISNLFLHHLSHDQAVGLLARMSQAADTVIINDLIRGPLGYVAARLGTRLLSRSPIVHIDGPRSVRAAFTLDEVRALADRAGLGSAKVESLFPFRWLLIWSRR